MLVENHYGLIFLFNLLLQFTLGKQENIAKKATIRLQEVLNKYNNKRNLSYSLSISVGQAECLKGQTIDLETLLSQADENMYKEKKAKRGQAPSLLSNVSNNYRNVEN